MISRSDISAWRSRISASSAFASLVTCAIRLQNISAKSSRARILATWTMHASNAVRLSGATSRITPASAAWASPAEVGDLRLRHPVQPRLGVAERVDASQVRDLAAEPRP